MILAQIAYPLAFIWSLSAINSSSIGLPSAFSIDEKISIKSVFLFWPQKLAIKLFAEITVGRNSALTGLGFIETKDMGTLGFVVLSIYEVF